MYLVNETMLSNAGYKTLHGDDYRRVADDPSFTSMRKAFYQLLNKPEKPRLGALHAGKKEERKMGAAPPKNKSNN